MVEEDIVTVPFAYLLEMHAQINASYEKLVETIGEPGTRALFAAAAEGIPSSGMTTAESSVDKLNELLKGAGYELTRTRERNVVEFSLACPYADRIHPHLGKNATYCPMSQTVLNTIRKKFPDSQIIENKLVNGGSKFTIRIEDALK